LFYPKILKNINFKVEKKKMGKYSYGIACLLALLLLACKTDEKNDLRKDSFFEQDLTTHLNAVQNRDYDALEPTVAEDVLMIGPDGSTLKSKTEFMKFHEDWFKLSNWKWQGKVLKTSTSDSLSHALVQYRYTESDSLGKEIYRSDAYLLLIFRKAENGWQLVHDQNTRIQEPNNP